MWVLLLLVMSSSGTVFIYDQGRFDSLDDCRHTGEAMVFQLEDSQKYACVEW